MRRKIDNEIDANILYDSMIQPRRMKLSEQILLVCVLVSINQYCVHVFRLQNLG